MKEQTYRYHISFQRILLLTFLSCLIVPKKITLVSAFQQRPPHQKKSSRSFRQYQQQQRHQLREHQNLDVSFRYEATSLCMMGNVDLSRSDNNNNENGGNNSKNYDDGSWTRLGCYTVISFFYWYLMVFGAAAQVNGLPVPDFIPMTPGWPATQQDFVPVIEDSYHFFYLSELVHNVDAPYVIPPRLSVFNFVEAWVFALLPVLWKDPKRLSRPILFVTWLTLGINLTNAFVAPYLAITEFLSLSQQQQQKQTTTTTLEESSTGSIISSYPKNRIISGIFGIIAAAVVTYAAIQAVTVSTSQDWNEFNALVLSDRTYFAFCLDPIVLSFFQPFVLSRVNNNNHNNNQPILDYIPFIGLVAWLFRDDEVKK